MTGYQTKRVLRFKVWIEVQLPDGTVVQDWITEGPWIGGGQKLVRLHVHGVVDVATARQLEGEEVLDIARGLKAEGWTDERVAERMGRTTRWVREMETGYAKQIFYRLKDGSRNPNDMGEQELLDYLAKVKGHPKHIQQAIDATEAALKRPQPLTYYEQTMAKIMAKVRDA
jgi:hypothetical protein